MTGRPCTVCEHGLRAQIDKRIAAGEPLNRIAKSVGLHRLALARHKSSHLLQNLVADEIAGPAKAPRPAGSLNDQLRGLVEEATGLLATSRKSGNVRAALAAIKAVHSLVESQAKLLDAARADPNGSNEPRVLVYLPDNSRGPVRADDAPPPAPLTDMVTLEDGSLTIRLSPDQLSAAVTTSPRTAFFVPDDGTRCKVTVTDRDQLAAAVLDALRHQDENGRTPVHELVDLAVSEIVSRRAPGLQIEHVTD
jgi:hypothetical protein